jgi:hypothetical protein
MRIDKISGFSLSFVISNFFLIMLLLSHLLSQFFLYVAYQSCPTFVGFLG